MAVLVEAISIIVRRDAIDQKFTGGWTAFCSAIPNGTLCEDGEIVRVGFMASQDAQRFGEFLESYGLTFLANGQAQDFGVVDQRQGKTVPCEWLEIAKMRIDDHGNQVGVAWLFEGERKGPGLHLPSGATLSGASITLATPDGWVYEESLSAKFTYHDTDNSSENLTWLRRENGSDVFFDNVSKKEVFVGRVGEDELEQ